MWLAILITVAAAAGNNIGKVLQKEATRTLPKFSVKREVLGQYLGSKTWLAGVAADVGGALLMIVAMALAPVSGAWSESWLSRAPLHDAAERRSPTGPLSRRQALAAGGAPP